MKQLPKSTPATELKPGLYGADHSSRVVLVLDLDRVTPAQCRLFVSHAEDLWRRVRAFVESAEGQGEAP